MQFPVLFALALMMAGSAAAQSEVGSGQVRGTFGAWQVRCGQLPGAKQEKCALVQYVRAEDRPNISLTVIFLRSFDSDQKVLRVVVPLGILLPTGLGLKIDDADVGKTQFLKCWSIGCVAEVVVDDALMAKMMKGGKASFIIFQQPDYGIGVPISLAGFAEGLKSLN
jgi:invasion protein IalB